MFLDYETLRLFWWGALGLLLIGFALTGGFDLGVAVLLPFIGKTDDQRRVIINSIGATWEGNQVWLVLGAGALFAAWPMTYAVCFSGLYLALLMTLLALLLRPLGFDYRSKLSHPTWRRSWDRALFIGGFVPAVSFGLVFGNLVQGLPFIIDTEMRISYYGSFWGLINPYGLLVGVMSLAVFVMHGAAYLQLKTEAELAESARKAFMLAVLVTLIAFALGGYGLTLVEGYHLTSEVIPDGPSNPLKKMAKRVPGLWLDNYGHYPALWKLTAVPFISGLLSMWMAYKRFTGWTFIMSAITVSAMILTFGFTLFPFLVPSSLSLSSSLTVWDASSSHRTLHIMFWATVIFLPLILIYTSWVFRVLKGKITEEMIRQNNHTFY